MLLFLTPVIAVAKNNSLFSEAECIDAIEYLLPDSDQIVDELELLEQQFTVYTAADLKPDTYYWFKLVLATDKLDETNYFIHFNDFFAEIYSVQFGADSVILRDYGGSQVPLKSRTHMGFFKDKVLLKKSDKLQTEIFLKVIRRGHYTYRFPNVNVIGESEYQSLKTNTDNTQSFFAGMIAILCLFNVVLFVLTREKIYLFYFIYAIVGSFYFFFYYDYIEHFLLPENPYGNRIFFFSHTLSQSLYFLFLFFAVRSQDIGKMRRLIFRYAVVITSVTIGAILFSLVDFGSAVTISDIMSVINGMTIFLLFASLIRKVSVTVKIILVGSLFLALGGASAIIANFFSHSITHIFMYQIGFCFELILFTLAINFTHYTERLERIRKQLDLARLQTEKLEKDRELEDLNKAIDKQNRELTYKAIVISQKESMQKNIIKQLTNLNEQDRIQKSSLQELISNLKANTNNNHWNEFESHFTSVHPLFYSSLNERYPNLTVGEYKLCSFLKMNLTSKEIALITGNSQQSVDVARSRLRKKMGLENHENINSIIAGIKSN